MRNLRWPGRPLSSRALAPEGRVGLPLKYYEALGAQRCEEGFPLWEVLHALNLTRRVLWKKIEEQGLLDTAEDFIQAMELHNQVLLFFDRAIMYTAKGYEVASPSRGA